MGFMIKFSLRSIFFKCKVFFFLLTCVFLLCFMACNSNREFLSHDLQEQMSKKREVQNAKGKEEFKITLKTPKPKKKQTYYWYKFGNIHNSESSYDGYLLNDTYTKFDNNLSLLEKGVFVKGLKTILS